MVCNPIHRPSQPLVIKHPSEQGFLVIFGTGSYITKDDARSEDIQSVYGIWDRLETMPATAADDTRRPGSSSRR